MEWLETDGLGGFASGTSSLVPTRRYHGLLIWPKRPPDERYLLLNGVEALVSSNGGTYALSSFKYSPGIFYPDGKHRILSFTTDPWPTWIFALENGLRIAHEIFMPHGRTMICMSWKIISGQAEHAELRVRPLISSRDYHSLHFQNGNISFLPEVDGAKVHWSPYSSVGGLEANSNGSYVHAPNWYNNFEYEEEQHRGFDFREDLASPGSFHFDLSKGKAVFLAAPLRGLPQGQAAELHRSLEASERERRQTFASPLHAAADSYVVERQPGKTIIAGYPWFTDWGRDTFISVRGLCLSQGGIEDAKKVLLGWTGNISKGMLPNRFPDGTGSPEYNSVDASLWFVIAASELGKADVSGELTMQQQAKLHSSILELVDGYFKGTRYGIECDDDGLLRAGEPGSNLTWMDARVDGVPVTPRVGKPVEIQALWINALAIAAEIDKKWSQPYEKAKASFVQKFWNEQRGCLHDVVDADHIPGKVDAKVRPNQIFAVGGLPQMILPQEKAKLVVGTVEAELLTPYGLRSLSPREEGYRSRYEGRATERDGSYHQGIVWTWLMGPFVEAWLRVNGGDADSRQAAYERFVQPLEGFAIENGGHLPELFDSEEPYLPRGCPFQAWSLAELLRAQRLIEDSE